MDKYAKDKEKLCLVLIKTDYCSFSVTDPVHLLSEIKNTCLTYKGVKHPCSILQNAISGVANIKQSNDEHPKDFAEKVKNRVNVLFDNLLNVFKEEDSDYLDKDPKERKQIEEKALEKYMAYLSIVKASNNICQRPQGKHETAAFIGHETISRDFDQSNGNSESELFQT